MSIKCAVCGKSRGCDEYPPGWITFIGGGISTVIVYKEEDEKGHMRVLKSVRGDMDFCSVDCMLNAGNDVVDRR